MAANRKIKSAKRTPIEIGLHLDVPGAALIEQVRDRIAWHQRSAELLATELATLSQPAGATPTPTTTDEWHQRVRRTDLKKMLDAHQEKVRYLAFVARHIARRRIYRLSGHELHLRQIMPPVW